MKQTYFTDSKLRDAVKAKGYDVYDVFEKLRRYTREEFRLTQTTCSQPHAIQNVQNMLEEEYSNIFEGNSGSELRRLVKSYIMRVHSSARTYSKARGRLIEDLSGGMSEGDDEDDEKESEVEFVEPVDTKNPRTRKAPLRSRQTPLMPIVAPSSLAMVATKSKSSYARASEGSSSRASSQRRNTDRSAAPSRSSLARNQDVEAVEIFLNNCVPPMTHFLERFLTYGCRNAQFLHSVSTLPRDGIVRFIRSLPCLDGGVMSEMEVFLLTENFLNYSP